MKILAIDDKQDNLTALRAVVQDAEPGATVLTASEGLAGIALAVAEAPDVILLDIVMPGMDGFEVCRRVKADDRLKDIPVVFLTAIKTDAPHRVKALELGAEGFLAKPLETSELTAQIRAMAKIKAANQRQRTERERLEALVATRTQELRESDMRYREIFSRSRDGFVMVDAEGRIIDANRAYCEMLGYSLDELTRFRSFYDVTPEKWQKWEYETIWCQRLLKQGTSGVYEKEYVRKDGSIFPVELTAYLVKDKDGTIDYLWAIVRDSTQRQKTEHAMQDALSRAQDSEASLHAIVANTPYAVFAHDLDGRILCVNLTACEYTGYSKDELLALTVGDIDAASITRRDRESIWQQLSNFHHLVIYSEHQRKDGTSYPAEITVTALVIRNEPVLLAIVQDITERRRMEHRLQVERDLALALGASDCLDESLELCLQATLSFSRMDAGGIYLIDLATGGMDLFCHQGLSEGFVNATRHFEANSPLAQTARNKRPTYTHYRESGWTGNSLHGPEYLQAVAMIPFQHHGGLIGCLVLASRTLDEVPLDACLAIEKVAGLIAQAIAERQAQDALRESEEKFRFLVNHSCDLIWMLRSDGIFSFVCPSLQTVLGCEPSYLVNKAFQPFVHPDDVSACEKYMAEVLDARHPLPGPQYRVKHAEETWRWHEGNITPVFADDGTFRYFVGVSRDITDRKRAEQEIQDHEAGLESLVRIIQHREADEQSFLSFAIEEAVQLTESKIGYICFYNEEKRELTLKTWSKDVMEVRSIEGPRTKCFLEHSGIWGEAVRQRKEIMVNQFEKTHPVEEGYPKGHAPLQRFLTIPIFCDDQIVAVVGVANKDADYENTDVLQLKLLMDGIWREIEAKRGLRERERLLSAIEQTDDVVIITTTTNGDIEYVNPAFEAVTGYGLDEVLGQNPRLLKSGEHDQAFYRELWETIADGRAWRGRMVNRRKDGTLFTEESRISPVKNASGQIVHFVSVQRDVTEHLLLNEEKNSLQEQLHQSRRLESIGRLAGGVAHDFNNMLGIILGYSETAYERLHPADPLRQDVKHIMEAGRRSADLVRQLLAFSRKQTLQPKIIDLNDVVRNLEKMLRRLIGEHIELEVVLATDIGRLLADPGQIEQVIMNLVVNARDAMAAGGKLRIETAVTERNQADLENHPELTPGRYTCLAVADTGCGMDKEVLSQIFDPFFTTKRMGQGTGLGLATAYGIVKQSGGDIWVESEPGRGTTFKIFLPPTETKPETQDTTVEPGRRAQGRGQILVVEDEPSLRRLMESLLSRLGYTVTLAANGGEALRLVEEKDVAPDLIITDVVMPNMSGSQLIDRLQRSHPQIRALYMSGYADDAIAHHGVLDPGTPFIPKPFGIDDLAQKVERAMRRP